MTRHIDGFLGNFTSTTEITSRFPPEQYAGCSANLITSNTSNKMWCDGSQWSVLSSSALSSLVSAPWILNGATAGQDSGWVPYVAGMRLTYALDSGTTSTTFSVDISADGSTSLGQAFTGTYASSSAYETTPPIWLSNQAARFIRFNVLSGGPLSVRANV